VICQGYPMAFLHGEVVQRQDVLCPPDSWPDTAVRQPAWREALQRERMYFDVYRQVVLRWNAHVSARPQERFLVSEYFDYLLNVYDRLASVDREIGDDGLVQIRDCWGILPNFASRRGSGEGDTAAQLSVSAGEHPWIDYLVQVKAVIDSFFPGLEPQPLRLPAWVERTASSQADVAAAPAPRA
jgi:hypothetical protein